MQQACEASLQWLGVDVIDLWNQMWGMRNRIAHGYLLLEAAIVARTLERDVPLLIDIVKSAIDQLTAGTDPDRPRGL